jgi:hypothetical protein
MVFFPTISSKFSSYAALSLRYSLSKSAFANWCNNYNSSYSRCNRHN